MPHRHEIVSFRDDTPPGATPWVAGAAPATDIEVVDPDPAWRAAYEQLVRRIRDALRWRALQLEHVGSTAVPGLPAKPIIDVDLTVADPHDEASYVPALEAVGFRLRVREPCWYGHRALRADDPACNLHVFGPDSPELVKHRIFRDWLRGNPDDRELYARTKREAAAAANAAGEHVMEYNARKERVVREIYDRAFLATGLRLGDARRSRSLPAVALRPVTERDLAVLTGGDSPFDDFGPRSQRTEPPSPDLAGRGGLAIVDPATGEVLGNLSWLWMPWGPNPESRNPMIGIWLRREVRGRGVGTAAQRMLVDRFFAETDVHRVEAGTDVENLAEQRALERAGFSREGIARQAQWRGGAFHDCCLYSVLRDEWPGEADTGPAVDHGLRRST